MENTQFSLLNAIFGGKFAGGKVAGDPLANGKPGPQGDPAAKDADGFFSFLEGLLKSAPGKGEGADDDAGNDSGDALAGSLFAGQPQPLNSVDANTLREALEGKFAESGMIKVRPGPSTDPVGQFNGPLPLVNGLLPLGLPQGDAAPMADTLSDEAALMVLGKDAAIKPEIILPGQVTTAQPADQAIIAAQHGVKKAGAVVDAKLSDELADAQDIDIDVDGRSREGASRFDTPVLKTQIDGPNVVLPPLANAALAMGEQSAPDALIHTSVARDEVTAMDTDRSAASRLEIVSHATDRNAHVNPIRDQVMAAVSARHGENKLEIRLDPPELGKILIGFDRDGTDIVRAVISADSPDTLDLMRRHADVFQRALEAQGFENLDLHFADKGPGENPNNMTDETFQNFRLAEEQGQADIISSAPHLVDGRLDRRL